MHGDEDFSSSSTQVLANEDNFEETLINVEIENAKKIPGATARTRTT